MPEHVTGASDISLCAAGVNAAAVVVISDVDVLIEPIEGVNDVGAVTNGVRDISDDGVVVGVMVIVDDIVGVVGAIMVAGAVTVVTVIICDRSTAISVRDTAITVVDVVIPGNSATANPVHAAAIDTDILVTVAVVVIEEDVDVAATTVD